MGDWFAGVCGDMAEETIREVLGRIDSATLVTLHQMAALEVSLSRRPAPVDGCTLASEAVRGVQVDVVPPTPDPPPLARHLVAEYDWAYPRLVSDLVFVQARALQRREVDPTLDG